jgi:hypothetical protein
MGVYERVGAPNTFSWGVAYMRVYLSIFSSARTQSAHGLYRTGLDTDLAAREKIFPSSA